MKKLIFSKVTSYRSEILVKMNFVSDFLKGFAQLKS